MKKGKMEKMEMDMSMGMDWASMALSVVMVALGIWFLAGGFVTQFNQTGRNFDWMVAVWYLIGVALIWYGKMWGHKSCGCGCCGMEY